jgi:hypothetical protein
VRATVASAAGAGVRAPAAPDGPADAAPDGSAGVRATSASAGCGPGSGFGGPSPPSKIFCARATSGPPRAMRARRFSSVDRGASPAPPMNGVPLETAASPSPNSQSAAQSDIPDAIVLSDGEASHAGSEAAAGAACAAAGAAGAGAAAPAAAARATPAGLGTSRIAARTGSGLPCRAATDRPRESPDARAIVAWRPRRRRPICGLEGRGEVSSIEGHCSGASGSPGA